MVLSDELLKQTLFALTEIPTVSGMEYTAEERLRELLGEHFDSIEKRPGGSYVLIRKSGKRNAKKLMIDAHFDEVGFMVTDVLEDGFLSVTSVGGIDTRILPAARINVYANETFPAYFASTPPHLRDRSAHGKAPELSSLLLDTSLGDKAKELIPVGTLCGYASRNCELLFGCVSGHGYDNKASCAAALCAAMCADKSKLKYDIYVHLSSREEVGCVTARGDALALRPDVAIVLDVEFADFPGIREDHTVTRGKGCDITYSPICSKKLNARLTAIASECDIPLQRICYASYTGTNADVINMNGAGVACTLLGIPLSNMHTAEEIVSISDLTGAARLLKEFAERGE